MISTLSSFIAAPAVPKSDIAPQELVGTVNFGLTLGDAKAGAGLTDSPDLERSRAELSELVAGRDIDPSAGANAQIFALTQLNQSGNQLPLSGTSLPRGLPGESENGEAALGGQNRSKEADVSPFAAPLSGTIQDGRAGQTALAPEGLVQTPLAKPAARIEVSRDSGPGQRPLQGEFPAVTRNPPPAADTQTFTGAERSPSQNVRPPAVQAKGPEITKLSTSQLAPQTGPAPSAASLSGPGPSETAPKVAPPQSQPPASKTQPETAPVPAPTPPRTDGAAKPLEARASAISQPIESAAAPVDRAGASLGMAESAKGAPPKGPSLATDASGETTQPAASTRQGTAPDLAIPPASAAPISEAAETLQTAFAASSNVLRQTNLRPETPTETPNKAPAEIPPRAQAPSVRPAALPIGAEPGEADFAPAPQSLAPSPLAQPLAAQQNLQGGADTSGASHPTPPPTLLAQAITAPSAPPPNPLTPAADPSATARLAAQLESTIEQLTETRSNAQANRPELTVRHQEFGAITMRIETLGNDLRATLSARDPGFVPAIQTALAERAVAASSETASSSGQRGSDQGSFQSNSQASNFGGSQGQGQGQGWHSEGRYGSSTGSGQGTSQPYTGQTGNRDEDTGSSLDADTRSGGGQAGDGERFA